MCARARSLFLAQNSLVELDGPVKICGACLLLKVLVLARCLYSRFLGDVHGQYSDLLRLLELGGQPSVTNPYLFLGDYVDRGKQSIETVCLLLAYKLKLPEHFHLLRGNHESSNINRLYGVYDECENAIVSCSDFFLTKLNEFQANIATR